MNRAVCGRLCCTGRDRLEARRRLQDNVISGLSADDFKQFKRDSDACRKRCIAAEFGKPVLFFVRTLRELSIVINFTRFVDQLMKNRLQVHVVNFRSRVIVT